MKKFLVIATLIIGIIGCSKDDDSQINTELVGTWSIVDGELNGQRTSQLPNLTYEDRQSRDCAKRSTFKFLSNGDFRGVFYMPEIALDYSNGNYKFVYRGCRRAIDLDDLAEKGSIKYKVVDKKIIIYAKDNDGSSNEVEFFKIESLSRETLKVSYSEEMKQELRSAYEQGKQIAQQYGIDVPHNIEVALNGYIIMEKQ
ncbi:lipocalin family protein [Capnocytophaga canis]|uniref:lipocalin family protein n=1 Tax=Capnocytophaga TaxID=1016 RepID=UPI000BB1D67D|nr:lipocalin family protein [Capnocytophaga sp. H4358]ATA72136.1 hypothetical protein CGC49_01715 [Capnocytophaga sp. H4358]